MRLFKGFLIALVGLFIMITLISLLMPSNVTTVRTVMINATPDKIHHELFNIDNWKHWHPVFIRDSQQIKISQPSTGLQAFAEWNSNGEQNKILFTEVSPTMLRASYERTNESPIMNIISVMPVHDSTGNQVEWRTLMKLEWYPWEKFAGIFADKISGPGYEAALNNLKKVCESR